LGKTALTLLPLRGRNHQAKWIDISLSTDPDPCIRIPDSDNLPTVASRQGESKNELPEF